MTAEEDEDELTAPPPPLKATSPEEERFLNLRAALQNLVDELRAATAARNQLGMKVNVAVRVAESALRRYPLVEANPPR